MTCAPAKIARSLSGTHEGTVAKADNARAGAKETLDNVRCIVVVVAGGDRSLSGVLTSNSVSWTWS
jgi:hypothetical protein